jgi:hypothetical protein
MEDVSIAHNNERARWIIAVCVVVCITAVLVGFPLLLGVVPAGSQTLDSTALRAAGVRLSCGAELLCDEPFCPSCAQEHREAMAKPRATGYAATASLCTVAGAQYQQAALAPEHRVFG